MDDTTDAKFVDQVYQDLRVIAKHLMAGERASHTLQPTALVNEAWLRMNRRQPVTVNDRSHLIAVATLQMRRALVDHARRHNASRRPDNRLRITLASAEIDSQNIADSHSLDLLDLCVALEVLEQRNKRHCQVFELRFFGGLTVDECATHLEVAPRTIKYDWKFAAAWIASRLQLDGPVNTSAHQPAPGV